MPVDLVTDAKALYDLLTKGEDPKPSDEGVLLWALWLRERLSRGSVRRTIWTCTFDMVSDGLTKILPDQKALRDLQEKGEFHTNYSCLCDGELWEPWKGLPPPKHSRAKDEATRAFLQAFAGADSAVHNLTMLGLNLGPRTET